MSNRRRMGSVTLVTAVFLLPYVQLSWWQFCFTTVVLLGLWLRRWRGDGFARLGLGLTVRHGLAVLVAFPIVWLASSAVQGRVAAAAGLERTWLRCPENFDPLFQALNEEMLLGWLLLLALLRWIRNPHALAWMTAAIFASAHVAFYRCGSTVHATWLAPGTVATLLLGGACRNYLIPSCGHVGYPWVLHGAWNLWFFGGVWRSQTTGARLAEPALFDAILGHPAVLAIVASMTVATGLVMVRCGVHARMLRIADDQIPRDASPRTSPDSGDARQ